MPCSSDEARLRKIADLRHLRSVSYLSEDDQCMVVFEVCEVCSEWFEEEFEEARAKVIRGSDFLCISCDPESDKPDCLAGYFTEKTD